MVIIDWEKRAKERRLENKALKKRIKEITTSRDFWKNKYMDLKDVHDETLGKMVQIKKNIQKIEEI
jgi:hypothetical protein